MVRADVLEAWLELLTLAEAFELELAARYNGAASDQPDQAQSI